MNLIVEYIKVKKRYEFKIKLINSAGQCGKQCLLPLLKKHSHCIDSCVQCDLIALREYSIKDIITKLLDEAKYGQYYFEFLYDDKIINSIDKYNSMREDFIKELESML